MERLSNKWSRLAVVLLTALMMAGCVQRDEDLIPQWMTPYEYLNRTVCDEVKELVNDAFVVLLAEQWAAIDSLDSRESFAKEKFQKCRLVEYADSIEIYVPEYVEQRFDEEREIWLPSYYDTIRRVVYREVLPEAVLSTDEGAVRSYGKMTLCAKGDNRYFVERQVYPSVSMAVELLHRPDFKTGYDLFVITEGLRAGNHDELDLEYSLEELMVLTNNRFVAFNYGHYVIMLYNRISIFNGRIDVAAKASSMSVRDKYYLEYVYTDTYNVVEK